MTFLNQFDVPIICITGTDTGVGKTVYAGYLAKKLSDSRSVVTQKWVQCGDLDQPDIQTHDRLSGIDYGHQNIKHLRQVYSFKSPVSPHLAEKIDNNKLKSPNLIDETKLINSTKELANRFDIVLLETSGGIMVPINDKTTTGDLVAKLKVPTIVVIANKLGAINHALLTLNYLKSKKVPILGFVINNFFESSKVIKEDNPRIIESLSGVSCIDTLTVHQNVVTLN